MTFTENMCDSVWNVHVSLENGPEFHSLRGEMCVHQCREVKQHAHEKQHVFPITLYQSVFIYKVAVYVVAPHDPLNDEWMVFMFLSTMASGC